MMSEKLIIWTIYKKGGLPPFSHNYTAIKFEILPEGPKLTSEAMIAPEVEIIRAELRRRGLTVIPRSPEDNVNIIESWL
jgi:hypothetical protein